MSVPYETSFSQPAVLGMITMGAIAIAIIAFGKDTALLTPIIAAIPTLAGIDRYLHVRGNENKQEAGRTEAKT